MPHSLVPLLSMATVVGCILTLKAAGFYTGLVYLAIMAAAAAVAAYRSHSVWYTIPLALLSAAASIWAYRVDAENSHNSWAVTYTDVIPYLIIASACTTVVPLLVIDFTFDANVNAVVRVFMFKLTVSVLAIVMSVVFHDLTKQFDSTTVLLDSTDRLKCNNTIIAADQDAIFSGSDTPPCPYKEWNHLRYIVLLIVQVYCTYLLTTEAHFYKGIYNKLVLGEVTMWTLASLTQLNAVKEWYNIKLTTIMFVVVGAAFYTGREVRAMPTKAVISGDTSPISADTSLLSKLKL